MYIYKLERSTFLKANLDEVWEFFSKPENLNTLTPPSMHFEIIGDQAPAKMFAGQIICYKISPFQGIRFRWTTEITHCVDKTYFIDEQRFGPYSFWHHLHRYEKKEDGVMMFDTIHYALPAGFIGRLMHRLFIRKKLESIFDFREEASQSLPFVKR
ncbi:MAG: SRPBCC family protein [Flavobacteriales bacterium]|nr:SRPBCC family protein [Flavobacteriales bacterium]